MNAQAENRQHGRDRAQPGHLLAALTHAEPGRDLDLAGGDFSQGLVHDFAVHVRGTVGHQAVQGPLHDQVDHSEVAARGLPQPGRRVFRYGNLRAHAGQLVVHVAGGLLLVQRNHGQENAYATAQLTQVRLVQLFLEFRLAHEQNLHQLFAFLFQVGKHAQDLKGFRGEVVRLVHDDRAVEAVGVAVEQEIVQGFDQPDQVDLFVHLQAEIPGNSQEQFLAVQQGVENPGRGQFFPLQGAQELVEQGGFAHAHLAHEHEKTLAASDAVVQFLKDALGVGGVKIALGAGRGGKGIGFEFQARKNVVAHAFASRVLKCETVSED